MMVSVSQALTHTATKSHLAQRQPAWLLARPPDCFLGQAPVHRETGSKIQTFRASALNHEANVEVTLGALLPRSAGGAPESPGSFSIMKYSFK